MNLILYHGKCTNGWAAAYVASGKYPAAELVALNYGMTDEELTGLVESVKGLDVLMVDFSLPTRTWNDLLSFSAKSLLILDHHRSAEKILEGASYAIFDMKRSGAGMAWDYLFGKDSDMALLGGGVGNERPWWVNYVEDYDIWTKKLPRIEEVAAYLHSSEKTIAAWDEIAKLDPTMAARFGMGCWQQIKYQTRHLVSMANLGQGWGLTVGIVNAPFFCSSEVAGELAETNDVGITWYQRQDGRFSFSLRSRGDIDVSKIAAKYGGGGHQHSAGFEMNSLMARDLLHFIIKAGPREPRKSGGCVR
jgi:uncharacterized protein